MTKRIEYPPILLGSSGEADYEKRFSLLNIESKEIEPIDLVINRGDVYSFLDSRTIITEDYKVVDIKTSKVLQTLEADKDESNFPSLLPVGDRISLVDYESVQYYYNKRLPVKYIVFFRNGKEYVVFQYDSKTRHLEELYTIQILDSDSFTYKDRYLIISKHVSNKIYVYDIENRGKLVKTMSGSDIRILSGDRLYSEKRRGKKLTITIFHLNSEDIERDIIIDKQFTLHVGSVVGYSFIQNGSNDYYMFISVNDSLYMLDTKTSIVHNIYFSDRREIAITSFKLSSNKFLETNGDILAFNYLGGTKLLIQGGYNMGEEVEEEENEEDEDLNYDQSGEPLDEEEREKRVNEKRAENEEERERYYVYDFKTNKQTDIEVNNPNVHLISDRYVLIDKKLFNLETNEYEKVPLQYLYEAIPYRTDKELQDIVELIVSLFRNTHFVTLNVRRLIAKFI